MTGRERSGRRVDVDFVMNRLLVFVLVAGMIAAIYALIVFGFGAVSGGEGQGTLLPILATAIIALAFEPFRVRAQHWANRLVYGHRSTPYEILSVLTERLAEAEPGDGMLVRIADLLKEGTGAERTTVWLGDPGHMVVGASSPAGWAGDEPGSDDAAVFPVRLDGETVGALELVKPSGIPMSTTERNLVNDVAGSVGLVLGYQRLNDSLARRAEELELSRHRLMEAQDLERRRLERDLHDGAQQQLVGLKVKIGIARQLAANGGHSGLVSLLDGLADEAQLALEEIRSLAKGIYPPVLESDGLVAAISGLAAGAPVAVTVERDGVGRYPAEVEAAIYFNVSEAVTNAIKHGSPPIRIDLVESDGMIRFEVTDSGSGFDVAEMKPGSGMNNMSDRLDALGGELTLTSEIGSGTTVRGEIPVSKTVQPV